MKKRTGFWAMTVCLLTLSLALVGCGGSDAGVTIQIKNDYTAPIRRIVVQDKNNNDTEVYADDVNIAPGATTELNVTLFQPLGDKYCTATVSVGYVNNRGTEQWSTLHDLRIQAKGTVKLQIDGYGDLKEY